MPSLFPGEKPPEPAKRSGSLFPGEKPPASRKKKDHEASFSDAIKDKSGQDSGAFDAALTSFNKPFEKITYGALTKLAPEWQGAQEAKKLKQQEYQTAEQQHPLASMAAEILGSGVRDLPAYVAGGSVAGAIGEALPILGRAGAAIGPKIPGYAKDITGALLGGSTVGGTEAMLTGETDPFQNALKEGGASAAVTAAFPALKFLTAKPAGALWDYASHLKPVVDYVSSPFMTTAALEKRHAKELFKGMNPEEIRKALETKKLAESMGLRLTPAEASGNPAVASREANIPKNPESIIEMNRFKEGQKGKQEAAINEFKAEIQNPVGIQSSGRKATPYSGDIDVDFRDAAKAAIEKQIAERAQKAAPLYEKAYQDIIPDDAFMALTEDGVIMDAYKKVSKDPVYAEKLKNIDPRSIEYVDYVKKQLDDQINSAYTRGLKNKGNLLVESKNKLVESADAISPNYKQARQTYAEDSPSIQALQKSEMGKIASLNDIDARKALQVVFDEAQPNSQRIKDLKESFIAADSENAKLWDSAVIEHLERKLDTISLNKSETHGTNFRKKIANTERSMDQWMAALDGNPVAQEKLKKLNTVFEDLVNSRSVKGDFGRAENNMNQARNQGNFLVNMASKVFNKEKEKQMLDMIKNGSWDKALADYEKTGSADSILRQMADIAGKDTGSDIKKRTLAIEIQKKSDEKNKQGNK